MLHGRRYWVVFAFMPAFLAADEAIDTKIGEVSLRLPKSWKSEAPSNRLRLAQFTVPPAEGDQESAEFTVFNFGSGGTVSQQVARWVDQFDAEGRRTKSVTGKSPIGDYVFVDLSGTYKKPIGPPIQRRTTPAPGSRMLVAMLAVEGRGNYFFKLVGAEKTVAENSERFRAVFQAVSDSEKPLVVE